MEKDHTPDALVDGGVRGEEQLSELPAVLLRVLHLDPLQAVSHGAYCGQAKGSQGAGQGCPAALLHGGSVTLPRVSSKTLLFIQIVKAPVSFFCLPGERPCLLSGYWLGNV